MTLSMMARSTVNALPDFCSVLRGRGSPPARKSAVLRDWTTISRLVLKIDVDIGRLAALRRSHIR
jgi:hypothetical protein